MNDRMRIGDLTERAAVTPRTVRYYESIGLFQKTAQQQVDSPTPIAHLLSSNV